MPDFIPHSGVVSMDNPEYILQEAKRRGLNNYHTLGIPVVPSPTSSLPAPQLARAISLQPTFRIIAPDSLYIYADAKWFLKPAQFKGHGGTFPLTQ